MLQDPVEILLMNEEGGAATSDPHGFAVVPGI
jgi:hypothetical protein